jgi:hypothetical protein
MYFDKPTDSEVESVKSGRVELGLCVKENTIFFLSKFSGMEWMDAPYSPYLSKNTRFDDLANDMGYALHVVLVDASSGIIKAMRLIGMQTHFSKILRKEILNQLGNDFSNQLHQERVDKVYKNYQTHSLVKYATTYTVKEQS